MNLDRLELDDMPPELVARLAPRVERLGYLGDFFRCTAHQPAALAAFHDFTEAGREALPANLVEVIALTASVRCGNDYERHQHERLALRLGLGRDWVAAVEAGVDATRSDPSLTPDESLVQAFVLSALDGEVPGAGESVPDTFSAVVDALGAASAVAVLLVLGRYVTHALIVNTLRLEPPVPSIFTDGFGT